MEKSDTINFERLGEFINNLKVVKPKTNQQLLLWIFEELGEISRTLARKERQNVDSLEQEMVDFITLVAAFYHRMKLPMSKIVTIFNAKSKEKNRETIT